MKKEWKIFLTAVMFLTRINVPKNIDHSPEYLQKAPRYFPVIGWIVGIACSLVFLVVARCISANLGILASMIAGVLITGALHEDGFADVCDGFGGGWTKEKILQIMKDSRIGVFGAIGLLAMLASKFLLLKELPLFSPDPLHPAPTGGMAVFFNYRYFILSLIPAHSLSRLMPILVIQWGHYATDPDNSKIRPLVNKKLSSTGLLFAILTAFTPFIFLSWPFLLIVLPMGYATYALARYFKKWIGGYTGDCLGAVQQVSELIFYLGFLLVWKYIA